jgi:hypothetical protein
MDETANQYVKKGDRVLISSDRLTFDPATGGPVIFTRGNGTACARAGRTVTVATKFGYCLSWLGHARVRHNSVVQNAGG